MPLDNLFALLDPAAPLPSADDRVTPVPGAEAAPLVGMQVALLYAAKSKVQRMLREEIQRLEGAQREV